MAASFSLVASCSVRSDGLQTQCSTEHSVLVTSSFTVKELATGEPVLRGAASVHIMGNSVHSLVSTENQIPKQTTFRITLRGTLPFGYYI